MQLQRLYRRLRHPFNWFERIYAEENPWHLDSPREQHRFRKTNEILLREFGHVHSIIEFGCGEGFQTEFLMKTADTIFGVDASQKAIERARKRLPSMRFEQGRIENYFGTYDVATAFETLYYVPEDELPLALANLEKSGKRRMVSYVRKHAALDSFVLKPGVQGEVISFPDGVEIQVAWW
jgi:2-polyprenyl-3-methyl-5-hydroxy-6-metoxy-1,4-benzoquinol methylase